MWVIGGEGSSGLFNDTWWSTDGISWTQATPNAAFPARWGHTSVVFDNKMWVIGGSSRSTSFNDVWYSSDGITWTQATPNAAFSARDSHSSVVFDNRMWVIGGESGPTLFNDVWYSGDGASWTEATASAAFLPRNSQTSLVFANEMWVIGGAPFPTGIAGVDGITKIEGSPSIAGAGTLTDVWYSTDGITWTLVAPDAISPFQPFGQSSVVFNDAMWAIEGVGSQEVWNSPLVFEAGFTGAPVIGSAPLTVQFTDTSVANVPTILNVQSTDTSVANAPGNGLIMWNWSFGDSTWFNTTDPSLKNAVHTYNAGTYDVSLTVTDLDFIGVGSASISTIRPTPASTNTMTRRGYITATSRFGDNSDNGPGGAQTTVPTPAQTTATTASSGPGTEVTANVGGNSGVYRAVVTGTGHTGLIVTGMVTSGPGQNITPAPGTVYQYLDLTPARYTTISGAVISFIVPLSWLNDNNIDPQNVVLYHLVGTTWTAVPTTFVKTVSGQVYFTATTPGFSKFAITGQSPPLAVQTTAAAPQSFGSLAAADPAPVVSTVVRTPVATQTTTAPVQPVQPSAGFPLATLGLGVVGCIVLVTGALVTRRWWIRKQNPALFRNDE